MGRGVLEADVDGVTLSAGPDGIIGRGLVIQGDGAGVACGAITAG